MRDKIIEIQYQTCNLCYALLRNINDNFINVSFDFVDHDSIVVKVVLSKRTDVEDGYIDDMSAEFTALQQRFDCVRKIQVEVGKHHVPLQNLVYHKAY